jgi:hypothetical protein
MNEKFEPKKVLPSNQICEVNVEVPTVVGVPMGPDGQSILCVQWFGSSADSSSSKASIEFNQFMFPIITEPHNGLFLSADPKDFIVVFVGMVKNWIAPYAAQVMIDSLGRGNENAWIIWMVNPRQAMSCANMLTPFSPCLPVSLLVCPDYGVVAPRPYADLRARDKAMQIFIETLVIKK